jgi:hypothetical protein
VHALARGVDGSRTRQAKLQSDAAAIILGSGHSGQQLPVKIHFTAQFSAHPYLFEEPPMSAPANHATDNHAAEPDAVEAIVPLMPLVLPVVGAIMMLLIAFIAVFMA